MRFPFYRPRRLRQNPTLRMLVQETRLAKESLIMPYFVVAGENRKEPISAMPGQYRYSSDQLIPELDRLLSLGLRAILLFGIPERKDDKASEAYAAEGVIQTAVRAIKKRFPELVVIADTCLCEYMSHGHCGVVRQEGGSYEVVNDASLPLLAKAALSQAEAGADIVAPSDMMDGRVQAIRKVLDEKGFSHVPILSYAAKYASAFYGPFREAAQSAPEFGDRRSYQMDHANREEALREIGMDLEEGADIVMVKPALAYLDVIRDAKETFHAPLAAYNVSGEYAMVKWAAEKGWNEKELVWEILTAIRRAGADVILTYHAVDVARWLSAI